MPPKVAAKVSAKAAATADEGPQATVADVHLIYAVNKNTEKPEINWAGVAADCGFKNADTAKVGLLYFNLTPSSGPMAALSSPPLLPVSPPYQKAKKITPGFETVQY
jgi:hypothetical protein